MTVEENLQVGELIGGRAEFRARIWCSSVSRS